MWLSTKSLLLIFGAMFFQNTTPGVELEKREILQNKLVVLVPKNWKSMPLATIRSRYPGSQSPQEVYIDSTGSLSIAFNYTDSKLTPDQLKTYAGVLKASIQKANPNSEWLQTGFIHVEGKEIGFFKILINNNGKKIFSQLFFTELKGRLLMGTFNCGETKLKNWKLIADQIMYSVHLN